MWTGCLVVKILIFWTGAFAAISQNDLDEIARNLEIKVNVVRNFAVGEHLYHKFDVTFENKGATSLPSSDWIIYFYSFFVIEPDHLLTKDGLSTKPEGYVSQNTKLKFKHINGNLFSMAPTTGFKQIPPNTIREISFNAALWAVAKSDVPPRWYIVAPGLSPRVLDSTVEEFVGEFTRAEQWKRTTSDTYNPYTPAQRFDRYITVNKNIQEKIIIPTPKNISLFDDTMVLNLTGNVVIRPNTFTNEANYLKNKTGFTISSTGSGDAVIVLEISNEITANEGYKLIIDPNIKMVLIQGKSATGIFYGIQSLLSLMANSPNIPKLEILDEPRFEFRGMYIDISRNFISKDVILKLLDVMSMYKMNKFHIHLADDEGWRIEIDGLPELTQVGSKRCHTETESECLIPQLGSGPDTTTSGSGYLTKADYIEILQAAKRRHIEVIPEVDSPGHARAAIKAMEVRYQAFKEKGQLEEAEKYRLIDPLDDSRYLSVQYFNDNAINPCINSTYTFFDKVVKEIKSLHDTAGNPLKTYHFGGDEVAKTAWLNSSACNDLNIQGDKKAYLKKLFAERVSMVAAKYGLNLQGWEDGFMEGGGPFPRNIYTNKEVIANAWDNVWEWGAGDRAYNLANGGYQVVLSHALHLYFDHPYEPDPEERGLYWATRFTDSFKTFGYLPDSVYENIDVDRMGVPLNREVICNNSKCRALEKPENIIGMQGHLWAETILSNENFYYMIFPRLLALAERAWYKAAWESVTDKNRRDAMMKEDWDNFAHTLGSKELKRLDDAGIRYRVPPPGAKIVGDVLETNTAYPGLIVEYSVNGKTDWKTGPITEPKNNIYLRARSTDGTRTSRVVQYSATTSSAIKKSFSYIFLLVLIGIVKYIPNLSL